MNLYDALNIFGLNNNYTEKELNKKYHFLAKQYHPDALINKSAEEIKAAEEKMKEINSAYDILKKNIKSSYNYKQNDNEEFDLNNSYKISIINIIRNYNWDNIDDKKEFKEVASEFKSFFRNCILDIMFLIQKKKLIDYLKNFKEKVKDWYIKLKDIYFRAYNITGNINFTINEDLSFDQFYEELEIIRNRANFIKEIDDIISSYELYAYYDEIKCEIIKLKNETIKRANGDYKQKDYYYQDLRNAVDNLFKYYSINKPLFMELEEIINKDNLAFQSKLESLREKIFSPLFYINYIQLKLDINNLSYHIYHIEHYDEIREIENNLARKYNEAKENINDEMKKKRLDYLYEAIIKAIINFLSIKMNNSFENVKFLAEIDFNNYEEAVKIYESVCKNLITANKANIYINISEKNAIASKHIRVANEEYDIKSVNGEKVVYEIYNNMDNNFVTLDEFMDESSEFFITFNWNGEPCIGLYRYNGLILCVYKDHLEFLNNIMINNIDFPKTNEFGVFQSKIFVKNLIIKKYYHDIEKFKNNNNLKKQKI